MRAGTTLALALRLFSLSYICAPDQEFLLGC